VPVFESERQLCGNEIRTADVFSGSYWIPCTIEDRPFSVWRIERPLTSETAWSRTRPLPVARPAGPVVAFRGGGLTQPNVHPRFPGRFNDVPNKS